jgi:hypothetical protein
MTESASKSLVENILLSINEIKEIYGDERFLSGDCANLTLAIARCLTDLSVPFGITIIDHFTSENDGDEESAVFKEQDMPECFSHCCIEVSGECLDIKGKNAYENWEEWLSLSCDVNKWGEYELLGYIDLDDSDSKSLMNSLAIVSEQSFVEINYSFIDELSKIIKKNLN